MKVMQLKAETFGKIGKGNKEKMNKNKNEFSKDNAHQQEQQRKGLVQNHSFHLRTGSLPKLEYQNQEIPKKAVNHKN
jgi:hypothetical protein